MSETMNIPRSEMSYFYWLLHSVDPAFYKGFRFVASKIFIFYLIITVFVCASIVILKTVLDVNEILSQAANDFSRTMPVIELKDYALTVNQKEPFSYYREDFQILVDPDERIGELDPLISRGIVFKKNDFIVTMGPDRVRQFSYKNLGIENLTIDGKTIQESQMELSLLVLFVWGGSRYLLISATTAFQVILAVMMIGIATDYSGKPVQGFHKINIAVTAIVPSIILETIGSLFLPESSGFMNLYLVVYAVFALAGTYSLISQIPDPNRDKQI